MSKVGKLLRGNRVLRFAVIVIVLGLLGLAVVSGISMWQEAKIPPEEIVIRAVTETLEAPSYHYYSEAKRIVDGQEETLSKINGEKNQGNTHLIGQIPVIDSEVEIYQVNDNFYRQDLVTKQWLIVEGHNEEATERLIQEIDPLGNFTFEGQIQVEYLGKEKINGVRCKKYQMQSFQEGSYLSSQWQEYYYTLWVDRDGLLQQAEVIAADHENKTEQMQLTVRFDWKAPVSEITAPVQ